MFSIEFSNDFDDATKVKQEMLDAISENSGEIKELDFGIKEYLSSMSKSQVADLIERNYMRDGEYLPFSQITKNAYARSVITQLALQLVDEKYIKTLGAIQGTYTEALMKAVQIFHKDQELPNTGNKRSGENFFRKIVTLLRNEDPNETSSANVDEFTPSVESDDTATGSAEQLAIDPVPMAMEVDEFNTFHEKLLKGARVTQMGMRSLHRNSAHITLSSPPYDKKLFTNIQIATDKETVLDENGHVHPFVKLEKAANGIYLSYVLNHKDINDVDPFDPEDVAKADIQFVRRVIGQVDENFDIDRNPKKASFALRYAMKGGATGRGVDSKMIEKVMDDMNQNLFFTVNDEFSANGKNLLNMLENELTGPMADPDLLDSIVKKVYDRDKDFLRTYLLENKNFRPVLFYTHPEMITDLGLEYSNNGGRREKKKKS